MFRRGLALCMALGLFTAVHAQSVSITMNPPGGTFAAGQQVDVDVFLTLTGAGGSKSLRMVQLDVSASHADLLATDVFPIVAGTINFWDFTTIAGCPGTCSTNHNVEPIPTGLRTNIGSITYLGLTTNAAEQLTLVENVAFRIGRVRLTMPNAPGSYPYSFIGTGPAPDAGAMVVYGFGVLAGDDEVRLTTGAGITGGTATFTVGGGCVDPAELASSFPPINGTLQRPSRNYIRMTLDAIPANPVVAGDFEIVEMLAGGGFGPDVSAGFTVTQDGANVILQEGLTAATMNGKWYRVRSTDQNCISVNLCYLTRYGDASNDKFTNFADLVNINSSIPTLPANISDGNRRRDINGDNFINFADMVAANGFIPSLSVAVPAGHTCP